MAAIRPAPPTAAELRAAFDAATPLTVGAEEEVMVLDPASLDLTPRAPQLLAALAGDPRVKAELPAAQIEVLTPPLDSAERVAAELVAGRRRALEAADAVGVRLAAAGVHPFAPPEGELSPGERYAALGEDYGVVIRRQLVFGLQVHVAVGGAERTLAVYNALRSHLPELAALAANAPFHAGHDTGLASIRPTICTTLPRQGVPPAIAGWESFADDLAWGAAAGTVPEPRRWWWELRPHPRFGTLELRVPDAQSTIADAEAVIAVAHALVARLAERHDAGEPLEPAPSWRIAENRWLALRHGLDGELADLRTGERRATRARLSALLDELEPLAARLGGARGLARARTLIEAGGGAARQRAAAEHGGLRAVVAALADAYPPDEVRAPGGGG